MQTLITLKIEKLTENNQVYFVATSDDLSGLVAEGKTIEEVIEIAEDVAKILLELEEETSNKKIIKDVLSVFEYPLFMEV